MPQQKEKLGVKKPKQIKTSKTISKRVSNNSKSTRNRRRTKFAGGENPDDIDIITHVHNDEEMQFINFKKDMLAVFAIPTRRVSLSDYYFEWENVLGVPKSGGKRSKKVKLGGSSNVHSQNNISIGLLTNTSSSRVSGDGGIHDNTDDDYDSLKSSGYLSTTGILLRNSLHVNTTFSRKLYELWVGYGMPKKMVDKDMYITIIQLFCQEYKKNPNEYLQLLPNDIDLLKDTVCVEECNDASCLRRLWGHEDSYFNFIEHFRSTTYLATPEAPFTPLGDIVVRSLLTSTIFRSVVYQTYYTLLNKVKPTAKLIGDITTYISNKLFEKYRHFDKALISMLVKNVVSLYAHGELHASNATNEHDEDEVTFHGSLIILLFTTCFILNNNNKTELYMDIFRGDDMEDIMKCHSLKFVTDDEMISIKHIDNQPLFTDEYLFHIEELAHLTFVKWLFFKYDDIYDDQSSFLRAPKTMLGFKILSSMFVNIPSKYNPNEYMLGVNKDSEFLKYCLAQEGWLQEVRDYEKTIETIDTLEDNVLITWIIKYIQVYKKFAQNQNSTESITATIEDIVGNSDEQEFFKQLHRILEKTVFSDDITDLLYYPTKFRDTLFTIFLNKNRQINEHDISLAWMDFENKDEFESNELEQDVDLLFIKSYIETETDTDTNTSRLDKLYKMREEILSEYSDDEKKIVDLYQQSLCKKIISKNGQNVFDSDNKYIEIGLNNANIKTTIDITEFKNGKVLSKIIQQIINEEQKATFLTSKMLNQTIYEQQMASTLKAWTASSFLKSKMSSTMKTFNGKSLNLEKIKKDIANSLIKGLIEDTRIITGTKRVIVEYSTQQFSNTFNNKMISNASLIGMAFIPYGQFVNFSMTYDIHDKYKLIYQSLEESSKTSLLAEAKTSPAVTKRHIDPLKVAVLRVADYCYYEMAITVFDSRNEPHTAVYVLVLPVKIGRTGTSKSCQKKGGKIKTRK
jgi:hypothetical protein